MTHSNSTIEEAVSNAWKQTTKGMLLAHIYSYFYFKHDRRLVVATTHTYNPSGIRWITLPGVRYAELTRAPKGDYVAKVASWKSKLLGDSQNTLWCVSDSALGIFLTQMDDGKLPEEAELTDFYDPLVDAILDHMRVCHERELRGLPAL